jgi:S-DNA-T family DNA segregation ATPase FtsK/SpoIIIE
METIEDFNKILKAFKIQATCVAANQVDNYLYYDLKLDPSAKVKGIEKFSDEISLALKSPCKPSFKIMRELGLVRLEFVFPSEKTLQLFDFFTNVDVPEGELIALLGQTVDGKKVWMDLAQNPHMIVAGTTGSGKSSLLHNIIGNMLNYNDCLMYLVDPKNIEFCHYRQLEHRGIKVVHSFLSAMVVLDTLLATMNGRYELIRKGHDVANFDNILLIVDEFADLILQDQEDVFLTKLLTLAQKCRAAHIFIILATQRPTVNIVNGSIKANFPARIACKVASHTDSNVILDVSGAENLLGKGDALLRDNDRYLERFQVAYTTATEVCSYFGEQNQCAS